MKPKNRKYVVSCRLSPEEYIRFIELTTSLKTTPSLLLRSYINSMTCFVNVGGKKNENN